MLNAAIIGLGWWGRELVRSVQGASRLLQFVRGVTLEPEVAAEFAAEMKMPIGKSYEEVLADSRIDAVVLATPHSRHRSQVEAAAAAGKHVFCEKPFALTKADAEAAIAACRRAGVAVGVGHNRRLWPSIKQLDELIKSGALGTIMHVEGNYSHDWLANQPADHWRSAAAETRAGGMTGMGIHLLDTYSFLIGPMRRVSALAIRRKLPLDFGADRVSEWRDSHARDLVEDALCLAPRGLRQRRLGGEHERNRPHDPAPHWQARDTRHRAHQPHWAKSGILCRRRARARQVSYRRPCNPAHGRRPGGGVPLSGEGRSVAGGRLDTAGANFYFTACGFIGEPVPPVITRGAPQKKNS